MDLNIEPLATSAAPLQRLAEWLDKNNENKLLAAIVTVVLGVILRDLVPYLWNVMGKFLIWGGKHIGGRFGFRYFEKTYLSWLVTELGELKLAGIVSTDVAKKPRLEQVFISLRVGEQQDKLSLPELTQAVIEDLRRHRKSDFGLLAALQREFEAAPALERKDAEQILHSFLSSRINPLEKWLGLVIRRFRSGPGDAADGVVERFFGQANRMPGSPSADLAAVLFRKTLRDQSRIAILGAPGSGKTTLLQFVGLAYARTRAGDLKLRDKKALEARLGTQTWRVPIFVSLSSVATMLSEKLPDGRQPSIIDILPRTLPPDLQNSAARDYFAERLKKGKCIVLLDGLDEVPTEDELRAVTRAIESLAISFGDNQFVVSSRVAGWRTGVGGDFKQYFVNDLNSDQVETFIRTWYSAVELNSVVGSLKDESQTDKTNRERRANKRAENLRTALRENPGIRQLASNPMLLSIIALVHRSLTNLPQERSKLYAECAKILLEQWDVLRGVHVDDTQLSLDQKEVVIRRIAFALHTGEIGKEGGSREATREQVEQVIGEVLPHLAKPTLDAPHLLRRLVERSGLLVERQRDTLAFAHLTFQEYFTARYLARVDRSDTRDFLLEPVRIANDWWRETILLYSGMLSDSSEFLRRLHGSPDQDSWLRPRLRLSAASLGEATQVKQSQVRQSLGKDLIRIRTAGQITKFSDNLPAEIVAYLTVWSKSNRWYSNALTFSFRDAPAEVKPKVFEFITKLIENKNLSLAQGALETMSLMPAELLSEGLVLRSFGFLNGPREWLGRASEIVALLSKKCPTGRIESELLKVLASRKNFIVVAGLAITREIGHEITNSEEVVKRVVDLFSNPSWQVRQEAAKAFLQVSSALSLSYFDALVKLLSDSDSDVALETRKTLTEILRRNPSPELVVQRTELLRHESENVRAFAVSALRGLDKETISRVAVVGRLIEMYGDKSEQVQDAIVETLKNFSDKGLADEVVAQTIKVASSARHSGRPCALKVLGHVGRFHHGSDAAAEILAGLKCRQSQIKCAAASAFGAANQQGPQEQEIEELCSMARNGRKGVRIAALKALGTAAHKDRFEELIKIIGDALQDKDAEIRSAAAHAAVSFGTLGKEFVPSLLSDVGVQSRDGFRASFSSRFIIRSKLSVPFFMRGRYTDFGKNSLRALTAVVPVADTENVIAELYAIAASASVSPPALLQIIETMSDIGAKSSSIRALDYLFRLVPHFYELVSPLRPIYFVRGFRLLEADFAHPSIEYEREFDLDKRLLQVAQKVEPIKAAKEIKSALESHNVPLRRLALSIISQLEPSVSGELLPVVLKLVADDDHSTRERSWDVISQVYTRKGTWKSEDIISADDVGSPEF
jgi:HEAT repeat protein